MIQETINFDTLKFNLYEVLGVMNDASENKIKKAFRNLMLNFHPDKNNKIEEDIFYHIITANQVLTNKEQREQYNKYLNKNEDSHFDLKVKFNKTIDKIIYEPNTNKDKKFEELNKEFELKHLQNFKNNENIMIDYNKLINSRSEPIQIVHENITGKDDFNLKFEKKNSQYFKNNIIPSNEKMNLSSLNTNENYTSLDLAFNNLYVEGNNTSSFSTLDSAFKIQSIDNINYNKNKDIKELINEYKENSRNIFTNINYTKEKFESWL